MKKFLLLLIIVLTSCQSAKFFDKGEVAFNNTIEALPMQLINDIPIVEVLINGKKYNFLFDTGAPTVISESIYDELKLKPVFTNKVTDGVKTNQQKFVQVPEIQVGNIVYSNVPAIVLDLVEPEFSCYDLKGIVGANQMAKTVVKVNYSNNSILISKKLKSFLLDEYPIKMAFTPEASKTPMVKGEVLGFEHNFTFDTGFSGIVQFKNRDNKLKEKIKNKKFITSKGLTAIGAYGSIAQDTSYTFVETVTIAGNPFENIQVNTGSTTIIGNEFFKNFEFILDWENNVIHLKQLNQVDATFSTFGFAHRFMDGKAIVLKTYNIKDFPLEIGDVITAMNGDDWENLSYEKSCELYKMGSKNMGKTIQISFRRNGVLFTTELNKLDFFKS